MEKLPFAGQLDTKVQIHKMEYTVNVARERIETPVLICDTKASVKSNTGTEGADTKVEVTGKSVYIIRKRAGVESKEKLTLTDGDTVFRITHVGKLTRAFLILTCESNG